MKSYVTVNHRSGILAKTKSQSRVDIGEPIMFRLKIRIARK